MADEGTDPAAGFAALMSGAASAVAPDGPAEHWLNPDGSHRYGTHPDGSPKKAAGRPRRPPTVEELKTEKDAAAVDGKVIPPADRAPSRPGRRRRKAGAEKAEKPAESVPQHRPGVITKGVNKLYRRAGKIVRAMDPAVGAAIIAATENTAAEGEPDDSVGACWDEVARTNPRIRRFLLRMIAGGALGSLLWAHLPILAAIVMKDSIRKYIPFARIIAALADDDDDTAGDGADVGLGGLLAGLQPEDLAQMQGMVGAFMAQMAGDVAEGERHGRVA